MRREKESAGHMLPQYAGKAQAAQQPAKETRAEPQREARQGAARQGRAEGKKRTARAVREEQAKGKQKKRGRAKNPVKSSSSAGVGEIGKNMTALECGTTS